MVVFWDISQYTIERKPAEKVQVDGTVFLKKGSTHGFYVQCSGPTHQHCPGALVNTAFLLCSINS